MPDAAEELLAAMTLGEVMKGRNGAIQEGRARALSCRYGAGKQDWGVYRVVERQIAKGPVCLPRPWNAVLRTQRSCHHASGGLRLAAESYAAVFKREAHCIVSSSSEAGAASAFCGACQ